MHFNSFNLALDGLDSSNAFAVAQGDVINTTVTLDQLYAIGASHVRADVLQFFLGTGFLGDGTGVTSTFNFFNAGSMVSTLSSSSTTSGALASFGIFFPPANVPLTFDSFTNDVTTFCPCRAGQTGQTWQ